jgi:cation:H+ antiporter
LEKVWLIVPGLLLLIGGGEWLVRGASRLASLLGVPPVVIGLSVVAFGTSAPELAVSVLSAYRGQPDIAVGNVVGSNIVNILLILGLSAVVAPLAVSMRLIKIEVPMMIGTALLFFALAQDGKLTRLDGVILVGIFAAYLAWMARTARSETLLEDGVGRGERRCRARAGPISNLWRWLVRAGLDRAGVGVGVADSGRGRSGTHAGRERVGDWADHRRDWHLATRIGDLRDCQHARRARHLRRKCGRQQHLQHPVGAGIQQPRWRPMG